MQRFILIHGYVEQSTIFDQLIPLLPSTNIVNINLVDEFARWQPQPKINALAVAQYLAGHYQISATDVVIGHSMGGWIAIHLKAVTGATTIQLGSWTDQQKINFPVKSLPILRLLLVSGLSQSQTLLNYFKKQYHLAESKALYSQLVDGLATMSRHYIWQQQQTLFAPVPPLTVQPDLRVHAKRDNIVFTPDEPYTEVPGDHFSLVFHPALVADAINNTLRSLAQPAVSPPSI